MNTSSARALAPSLAPAPEPGAVEPDLDPEPVGAEVLQLVYEVADIMRVDGGEKEPRASVLAQIVIDGLRRRVGGASIYVLAPSRRTRNIAIRKMFNGSNLKEVCQKFQVSKTTVYRLAGNRVKR